MLIDATNGRKINFLLLFGASFFCASEMYANSLDEPLNSIYNRKLRNKADTHPIVKAPNKIYTNNYPKRSTKGHKNRLARKMKSPVLDTTYQNNLHKKWNILALENALDEQFFFMGDYRSRLYPYGGHVFYDHYLSEMQKSKKEHHSFRKFLHNFRLHLSLGGELTFCRTDVNGYLWEDNGKYYIAPIHDKDPETKVHEVGLFGQAYRKVPTIDSSKNFTILDTNVKTYKGWIKSFELLNVGVSYDIFSRLRFLISYNLKGNSISVLKRHYVDDDEKTSIHAKATPENIDTFYLPKSFFWSSDLKFMLSPKIVNTTFWSVLLNGLISLSFIYGEKGKIVDGHWVHGFDNFKPGFGCGLTIERHLSDYISLFGTALFNVTKMSWINEKAASVKNLNITHWMTTGSLEFGINFTTSYIDKCEHELGCHIKEVHIHNSKEYRGLDKWHYRSPYGKVIHSAR